MHPSPTPKSNSLTPQRKHHKLLKDGSEVWSADVEKIFVDGLRKYWDSPWATYSRGRSRWRNQFLVDHLKASGVHRSKKQVASHIQVLRNMWRGEPEFHLVAGGEELFQENGLLASPNSKSSTQSPEPPPPTTLDPPEQSPSYPPSSSSSSSEFLLGTDLASFPDVPVPSVLDFIDPTLDESLHVPLPDNDPFATIPSIRSHARPPVKLEPLALDPALFTLPSNSFPEVSEFASFAPHIAPPSNRVCTLSLWADGMHPFMVDVDRLLSDPPTSAAPRVVIRMTLHCPPRVGPAQQGFQGAVGFAARWAGVAQCHTKSWAGNTLIAHEVGILDAHAMPQLQSVHDGAPPQVVTYLPDSPLCHCMWLDSVNMITQQIVVDNEVLAVFMYSLERDGPGTQPAAQFVGFHKVARHSPPRASTSLPGFASSPAFPPSGSPQRSQTLFARPPSYNNDASPLSCALSYTRVDAGYGGSQSALNYPHLL